MMLEYINDIDKTLLLFLNGKGSFYWDNFMWIFSGRLMWIPVVLAFIWYYFRKGGWREAVFVIFIIALLITSCDQISSSICKPFFARLRPSHQDDLAPFLNLVNDYHGGRYGFISSHAANSMGYALFTTLLIRKPFYGISIFSWALVTCYSRIYLGVHFPGDVLAGTALGLFLGCVFYYFYRFIHHYFFVSFGFETANIPYEKQSPQIVLIILYVLIAALFISSGFIEPGYWVK